MKKKKKKIWQLLLQDQREREREEKNSSKFRRKISTPLLKQQTHQNNFKLLQNTKKVENSRKKCLNRLAMSILGSPSLPLCLFHGPCSLPHCSCRVIPCEHPERESWADSRAGRPTPWPCGQAEPMRVRVSEASSSALEGTAQRPHGEGKKQGGEGGGWSSDWEKDRKKSRWKSRDVEKVRGLFQQHLMAVWCW